MIAKRGEGFGKFRFSGYALQHAEMGVGRNRPHQQVLLFPRTCPTGICRVGAQKQFLPNQYFSLAIPHRRCGLALSILGLSRPPLRRARAARAAVAGLPFTGEEELRNARCRGFSAVASEAA